MLLEVGVGRCGIVGVRAVQVTCTLHDICMSVFKCTVISWTQGNRAQD